MTRPKWTALLGTVAVSAAVFAVIWLLDGSTHPVAAQPQPRKSLPTELDFLPRGVEVLVTLNLAEVRKTDSGKEMLAKLEKYEAANERVTKARGFKTAEVDRVTMFMPQAGMRGLPPLFAITFAAPLNTDTVLKRFGAKPAPRSDEEDGLGDPGSSRISTTTKAVIKKEPPLPTVPKRAPAPPSVPVANADAPFFSTSGDFDRQFYFVVDERTLVIGSTFLGSNHAMAALAGRLLQRKPDGPRAQGLQLAAEHHLVIDFTVPPLREWGGDVPAEYLPLFDARTVQIVADLDKELTAEGHAVYADEAAAKKASRSLKAALVLAEASLTRSKEDMKRQDPEKFAESIQFFDLLIESIDRIEVKPADDKLTVRVAVSPAMATRMIAALPGFFFPEPSDRPGNKDDGKIRSGGPTKQLKIETP